MQEAASLKGKLRVESREFPSWLPCTPTSNARWPQPERAFRRLYLGRDACRLAHPAQRQVRAPPYLRSEPPTESWDAPIRMRNWISGGPTYIVSTAQLSMGSLDIHVQKPSRCGHSDDSSLPDLDEEFFDARFTHRSHFGSAGNPIRRLRPTGQWTCWRTCWRHGGPRRLFLAGATTPFAWVAIWVTHSSGPRHRLLGRHRARPGRLASGCRGRGAAKCTRHAASGRNRLRFHQRSARAG